MSVQQVGATATLTCDIDDRTLKFSLQAAIGSTSAVGGAQGRLDLKGEGLPKLGFDMNSENISQHWIDEPDLRLWLRGPSEGASEIDLVLKTRQIGEADFSGDYRLKVSTAGKAVKRSGRVSCTLGY